MLRFSYGDDSVTAFLSGEIDHYTVQDIRKKIDMTIKERLPSRIILDFADVTFMDSSGIGLILGRFRLVRNIGGKIIIENASEHVGRILQISGIGKIAQICGKD